MIEFKILSIHGTQSLGIPTLNLLVQDTDSRATNILFNIFMGRRCEEGGMPEVQWLKVAIGSIAKVVQDMTGE